LAVSYAFFSKRRFPSQVRVLNTVSTRGFVRIWRIVRKRKLLTSFVFNNRQWSESHPLRKKALDLRSWQAASDLMRGWEASGEIGVVRREVPAVKEAVEKFITYQRSRHLSDERSASIRTCSIGDCLIGALTPAGTN
jgi:hypothetical protein